MLLDVWLSVLSWTPKSLDADHGDDARARLTYTYSGLGAKNNIASLRALQSSLLVGQLELLPS